MSGFGSLSNGQIVQSFFDALSGTFIGSWVYILLLLGLDIAFAMKIKSVEPVAIMNLLILYLLKEYLIPEAFYIMMIISIAALTVGLMKLFTNR